MKLDENWFRWYEYRSLRHMRPFFENRDMTINQFHFVIINNVLLK